MRGERHHFGDLLVCERQPAAQFRRQLGFLGDVMRDVLCGCRGGDRDREAGSLQGIEPGSRFGQIVEPDIMTVHNPGYYRLAGQQGQLFRGGNGTLEGVKVQGLDGRTCQGRQQFPQGAERGGDKDLRTGDCCTKHLVAAGNSSLDLGERHILIGDQRRLIQLHPAGTGGTEAAQQFNVNREYIFQTGQRAEICRCLIGGLAQQQERDRTNQVRASFKTVGQSVFKLFHHAG